MNFLLKDAMLMVAELMVVSARTAPKCLGQDFMGIKIVTGEDLNRLAEAMIRYGQEKEKRNFDRDGDNVRRSDAVLLLSLVDSKPLGLDCGACGHSRCADLKGTEGPEFYGPLCAWRLIDLGIALGSAVKTASLLNVDNRIMYRVGAAARTIGMIEGEVVVGIPISATSKNIYFDRPEKPSEQRL